MRSPGLNQLLIHQKPTLNSFAALPRQVRVRTRDVIIKLLSDGDSIVFRDSDLNQKAFHGLDAVTMHLPMQTTEFTDYSAAQEHVGNVSVRPALIHALVG